MLDLQQADKLVAALQQAGKGPQPVDAAALPLDLARARRHQWSDDFAALANQPVWYANAADSGLVGAAIGAFVGALGDVFD